MYIGTEIHQLRYISCLELVQFNLRPILALNLTFHIKFQKQMKNLIFWVSFPGVPNDRFSLDLQRLFNGISGIREDFVVFNRRLQDTNFGILVRGYC